MLRSRLLAVKRAACTAGLHPTGPAYILHDTQTLTQWTFEAKIAILRFEEIA